MQRISKMDRENYRQQLWLFSNHIIQSHLTF